MIDGKPLRNVADDRDAERLQAEEPRRGDAAADGHQRRGRMRPQALHRRSGSTNVATATASVSSEVSGTCCTTLRRSGKKPCLVMWMPSSFGTWSSTITRPMPALNPVSTGAEMKSATKPRRISRASISMAPTSAVSVAVAVTSLAGSPSGTTSAELGAGEDRQRGRSS